MNPPTVAAVPAVVVGASVNGLGVVRSLGQAGARVIVADTHAWQPAMHSRYAEQSHLVHALEGATFVDDLMRLGQSLPDPSVLFMTADWTVRTVSDHRDRVAERYRVRLPARQCLDMLLNKVLFQQFAEKHGLPVPRAVVVRAESDFGALVDLRFPAVVKPSVGELIEHHKVPRASRVPSREEAERACRAIFRVAPDDLIVQEWIEGADSDIYFCLQYRGAGGAPVASFTGRKLRSWPPRAGSTATCTAATKDVAAELDAITTRTFDMLGVEGMCGMEFKRDTRSRHFVMVEPTIGRTDWQEEIASFYGVNIPFAAYCHELGLPFSKREIDQSFVWRESLGYWRSRWATRSFHDPMPPGTVVKSTWWRLDDPLPGGFFCYELLRKASSRALSRVGLTTGHPLVVSKRT
jgi:predicted ATP-grasp superfamily ATP-dependent carboligase